MKYFFSVAVILFFSLTGIKAQDIYILEVAKQIGIKKFVEKRGKMVISEYRFNKKGNLVYFEEIDPVTGKPSVKKTYEYFDKPTPHVICKDDVSQSTIKSYYEDGKVVREEITQWKNLIADVYYSTKTRYYYNGNITTIVTGDDSSIVTNYSDGSPSNTEIYKKGQPVEKKSYWPDGSFHEIQLYEKGELLQSTVYRQDGQLESDEYIYLNEKTVFTYNEHNEPLLVNVYKNDTLTNQKRYYRDGKKILKTTLRMIERDSLTTSADSNTIIYGKEILQDLYSYNEYDSLKIHVLFASGKDTLEYETYAYAEGETICDIYKYNYIPETGKTSLVFKSKEITEVVPSGTLKKNFYYGTTPLFNFYYGSGVITNDKDLIATYIYKSESDSGYRSGSWLYYNDSLVSFSDIDTVYSRTDIKEDSSFTDGRLKSINRCTTSVNITDCMSYEYAYDVYGNCRSEKVYKNDDIFSRTKFTYENGLLTKKTTVEENSVLEERWKYNSKNYVVKIQRSLRVGGVESNNTVTVSYY